MSKGYLCSMRVVLVLVCCLITVDAQMCMLRSSRFLGTPAICGGFANAPCPKITDTCRFYPRANYGPCCMGCRFGPPLKICGGYFGETCPSGYVCNYDMPDAADSLGVCCSVDAQMCMLRSSHYDGTPAICGGFANAFCPKETDTCRFYPGANYGPCCMGCRFEPPLKLCGGFGGEPCPIGYVCNYDTPHMTDSWGVCCRGSGPFG